MDFKYPLLILVFLFTSISMDAYQGGRNGPRGYKAYKADKVWIRGHYYYFAPGNYEGDEQPFDPSTVVRDNTFHPSYLNDPNYYYFYETGDVQ